MTRSPSAPKHLSTESKHLWRDILRDHEILDAAGFALLRQLCETLDDLRAAQTRVADDGLMIASERGLRPHPLIAAISEHRRQILATIRALKLDISMED